MFDRKVALYGNESICKQLAYVLNIEKYTIIKDIKKYKSNKNTLIICNDYKNIKKYLHKLHLKNKKDYFKINYIYQRINKGYIKKLTIDRYRFYINKHNLINIIHIIRPTLKNIDLINKIPVEFLKTSEMFIKTINSKSLNIKCKNLEETCNIDNNGEMWGCCPGWIKLSYGNILNQEKYNEYNSYHARVIRLSSLNKTYCFCDFNNCRYAHKKEIAQDINKIKTDNYPKELTISIDKSCNLKCSSCRKCFYKSNDKEKQKLNKLAEEITKTGWLEKSKIVMAGQGEVFYSDTYKKIITSNIKRKSIKILTNGTLFNKKNWDLIEKIYKDIYVSISIDAATKETYKKLRYGNFDYLKKNLEMLGNLRKQKKIKEIQYNFVVQRANYNEIIEFVNMAKKLNVDLIQFTKLNNWGTYTDKEYIEKSMIIENKYLQYDLYKILENPIFKEKNIDIVSFEEYIKNSKEFYGEKDE